MNLSLRNLAIAAGLQVNRSHRKLDDDEAIGNEVEVDEELKIEAAMTAADVASVPTTMHLQIKV